MIKQTQLTFMHSIEYNSARRSFERTWPKNIDREPAYNLRNATDYYLIQLKTAKCIMRLAYRTALAATINGYPQSTCLFNIFHPVNILSSISSLHFNSFAVYKLSSYFSTNCKCTIWHWYFIHLCLSRRITAFFYHFTIKRAGATMEWP
jgi:hypothetical protein